MSSPNAKAIVIKFNGDTTALTDLLQQYRDVKNIGIQSVIDFINDWKSERPFILQKTSGSTGNPKTIKIWKSQIESSASATLSTLGIEAGENAMLCINPDYIGGKMMVARAIIGKLNLHLAPISGNPLWNYETESAINFFSFVPYQLERILDESPEKAAFLDQSKAIILGGAPVSDTLNRKIKSTLFQSKVYSTYGMTETVSHVALKLINSKNEEPFKALAGIRFSTDERNCLVVHAPKLTGQDSLITNDVVKLISSTEFHWLGRYDYVINSGGIKIHPELLEKEISQVFESHHIDNRFLVFGLPDDKLGESVNLVTEGELGNAFQLLKQNLKPFEAPKKIYSVEKFKETDSGKVSRTRTIEDIKPI